MIEGRGTFFILSNSYYIYVHIFGIDLFIIQNVIKKKKKNNEEKENRITSFVFTLDQSTVFDAIHYTTAQYITHLHKHIAQIELIT